MNIPGAMVLCTLIVSVVALILVPIMACIKAEKELKMRALDLEENEAEE